MDVSNTTNTDGEYRTTTPKTLGEPPWKALPRRFRMTVQDCLAYPLTVEFRMGAQVIAREYTEPLRLLSLVEIADRYSVRSFKLPVRKPVRKAVSTTASPLSPSPSMGARR